MRLDAEANDKEFDYNETRDANNSKAVRYEISCIIQTSIT